MIIGDVISLSTAFRAADPIVEPFINPEQGTALSIATAEAVHSGHRHAILAPVVHMAVWASLSICATDEAIRVFPDSVRDRADFAGAVAANMSVKAAEGSNSMILRHYAGDAILSSLLSTDPSLRDILCNPYKLVPMASSPFGDSSYVGGGAKRKLDELGITTEQASVVGSSRSLLLFARIDSNDTRTKIQKQLGGPAYIASKNFDVIQDDDEPSIEFTGAAVRHLREMMKLGGGCPITGARTADSNVNLLRESWQGIIELLLSDGAVVSL